MLNPIMEQILHSHLVAQLETRYLDPPEEAGDERARRRKIEALEAQRKACRRQMEEWAFKIMEAQDEIDEIDQELQGLGCLV